MQSRLNWIIYIKPRIQDYKTLAASIFIFELNVKLMPLIISASASYFVKGVQSSDSYFTVLKSGLD